MTFCVKKDLDKHCTQPHPSATKVQAWDRKFQTDAGSRDNGRAVIEAWVGEVSRAGLLFTWAERQGLLQEVEQTPGPRPVLEVEGRLPAPLYSPGVLTVTLSQPLATVAIAPTACEAAGPEEHGKNMAGTVAFWGL